MSNEVRCVLTASPHSIKHVEDGSATSCTQHFLIAQQTSFSVQLHIASVSCDSCVEYIAYKHQRLGPLVSLLTLPQWHIASQSWPEHPAPKTETSHPLQTTLNAICRLRLDTLPVRSLSTSTNARDRGRILRSLGTSHIRWDGPHIILRTWTFENSAL